MTNASQEAKMQELQKKLEEQSKQLELLTKIADKAKIQRFTPSEEKGQTVLISLYRQDLNDKPKVVLTWKLLRDEVRVTKNGVEEEQTVQITLEDKTEVEMSLSDFNKGYIEKERVPVIGQESMFGRDKFVVEYNGKKYKLAPNFIN